MLAERFEGREPDITEENLQARIRGNLLMALSNKFGWLVLTTGNKSETSVGYSTLYGDTAGGFAVIKDVPEDARLPARRLPQRARRASIRCRGSIIDRPPSAELRPDQKDQDSLPDYDTLDRDPRGLRRGGRRPRAADRAPACPRRRSTACSRSSTAPSTSAARRRPGIKITPRAFGRDRRMPITNRYGLGVRPASLPGERLASRGHAWHLSPCGGGGLTWRPDGDGIRTRRTGGRRRR